MKMKDKNAQKAIQVCAHWAGIADPLVMGTLYATEARGKEVFSFEYDPAWLQSDHRREIDPRLQLYTGPQYPAGDHPNFGLFLDSSPDRWGRVLMQRREAQQARQEGRDVAPLRESDYLLGVYDGHRMGGLRFRIATGPFLDDNAAMASPPWARLRELENASLQLEKEGAEEDPEYNKWLNVLIAPGSSLGGARPKASILDEDGHLWIAKFPSRKDERDMGMWEYTVHQLALAAGIESAPAKVHRFSGDYHTFLTKRFDRAENRERIHFSSAMTMLGRKDGDGADDGVSYLDLAEFLIRYGAHPDRDLEQLWRRIVFNMCISNTDDHLRNHGFLLLKKGWTLSPAYDMNPVATGEGLSLNVSKTDNAQNLDLAREVSPIFRVSGSKMEEIITTVIRSVRNWKDAASRFNIPSRDIDLMKRAFRLTAE
jgi:serine/threonine-protein kinase HipA